MNKILESIWPSILWTATVFILLAMPMGNSKETSFLDLVEFDKLVHLILFAILSFLWGNYFANKTERKQFFVLTTVVLVASVYGLSMEFYQKYLLGGFQIGQELLIINGLFTFLGLWLISSPNTEKK